MPENVQVHVYTDTMSNNITCSDLFEFFFYFNLQNQEMNSPLSAIKKAVYSKVG